MNAHGTFTVKGEDLIELDIQAREVISHFLGGIPLPTTFDYHIEAVRTGFQPISATGAVVYSAFLWEGTVTFNTSMAIIERARRESSRGY